MRFSCNIPEVLVSVLFLGTNVLHCKIWTLYIRSTLHSTTLCCICSTTWRCWWSCWGCIWPSSSLPRTSWSWLSQTLDCSETEWRCRCPSRWPTGTCNIYFLELAGKMTSSAIVSLSRHLYGSHSYEKQALQGISGLWVKALMFYCF